MTHISTDILIVGAGGAGMYAAVTAADAGADVVLADKSLVGRGGATVMAQMTVAAAVGHQAPDHWTHHLADTIAAGRGLCNEELAAILCREAPDRILEMNRWGVGWAHDDGRLRQVVAPGHSIARCCYADFLNTGPAVARTLRAQIARRDNIARISGLNVIECVVEDGRAAGAVCIDAESGDTVTVAAKAVILAAGGLTRLFRRNSASANMAGEAYALALAAGADLIDMEFVQFFPIGHLAPRLVGMDPIMWDPFRYKLGGRLLNGNFEEFIERYGATDSGTYTAVRDVAAYAITKEVEAGRGSPHGGAYLSFEHVPADELRRAFGPVIDRLAKNNIDLTKGPIEVAPIAHYHMGGIRVDERMQTRVAGLFAAGEAVGGAGGANRLSGNAIPEAFVFGQRAGRFAAAFATTVTGAWDGAPAAAVRAGDAPVDAPESAARLMHELQDLMWNDVGLLRTGDGLMAALARIRTMRTDRLPALGPPAPAPFDPAALDWFELRAALLCAEAVTLAALNRTESRGAHQREDLPDASPVLERNQVVMIDNGVLKTGWVPVVRHSFELEKTEAAE